MDQQSPSSDDYAIRLLAWVGLAFCVILSLYTTYLVLQRMPVLKVMLDDFDTKLPAVTGIVFRMRALAMVAPVVGVLLGVAALVGRRRWALSACWAAIVLSCATIVLLWYAIDVPMYSLTESLTGV